MPFLRDIQEHRFISIRFTGSGSGDYCFCRACLREFEADDEALGRYNRGKDGLTELVAVCDNECLAEYRSLQDVY